MTSKIIFACFLLGFLSLAFPTNAEAKRLLPYLRKATTSGARTASTGTGYGLKVKFMPSRLGIVATFSNMNSVSKISYIFSYTSRGVMQGASGSINTGEINTSREIIFGTCSHGVCRYDSGISNAQFVVTTTLQNGRKVVKTFRLKV
ncbi:MAG: hypothetical protein AAB656_02985 [Patescibacteria group bacterium]